MFGGADDGRNHFSTETSMIVVFYYTQSGQALEIAKRICQPLEAAGHEVAWRPIIPLQDYPFPWNKYEFFDSFPEARLGMPPSGIQPIDFTGIEDAELVMIVGQSWFLSPSLPLQSFMENKQVQAYLQGKKVIFVNACRNMWLMTSRVMRAYLREINCLKLPCMKIYKHAFLQTKHLCFT